MKRQNLIVKGFKFGMMLQLAVGPVCLYVLATAINTSFLNAFYAVLAVILVDSIFILIALAGIVSLLKEKRNIVIVKIIGGIILLLFGSNIILSVCHMNLIPSITISNDSTIENSFIYALLITASNPLSILFWSGVFSAKIAADNLEKKDLRRFAIGCILSTLIFLTGIGILGTIFHFYLSELLIDLLNIIVGLVLLIFGIRLLLKKEIIQSAIASHKP